jgi:heptosyltransferase-2
VHATKVYLQPLERLAIFEVDPVPRLSFGPRVSNPGQLALHPGSGSERKNWPEAKWADLVQHLINETGFKLLLVGGEAEGDRLQRLAAALPPARVRVAQSLPLTELAGLLQQSDAFIGHDSGISHLAAAVGLPGIVLWGDTVEEIWRPTGERVTMLRHPEGLANLPVSDVLARLKGLSG